MSTGQFSTSNDDRAWTMIGLSAWYALHFDILTIFLFLELVSDNILKRKGVIIR
jgi:hypothetical protein